MIRDAYRYKVASSSVNIYEYDHTPVTIWVNEDEKIIMCEIVSKSDADFIKTSTGKIDVAATPEAAVVMCQAIKDFYDKTGIMVGFKAAGGVKSPQDAALYYTIVEQILGEQWLTTDLFRIGASSAANNLLSAIVGKTVSHF